MLSCSSLHRYCGLSATLNKTRKKPPALEEYVKRTADEGSRFGALVQSYIEGGNPKPPEELDEVFSQFEEWRDNPRTRVIPRGEAKCEVAMGLSKTGQYVPVVEIYPHYYVPSHTEKSALGREPLYLPAAGDQSILATAGRLDVGWTIGNVAIVLDMKRSAAKYYDPEHVPQLMALGCMWALRHGLAWFQVGLYGARDGVYYWSTVISSVEETLPEVLRMAALSETEPTSGDHCGSCYEKRDCPEGRRLYPISRKPTKGKR
jgi:hypothetical protein